MTMLVRGAGDFRAALLALAAVIRLASLIAEPVYTDLLHAGLSWHGVDAEDSSQLQEFRVRDPVLPSQLQYSAEAAEMEVIQLPGLVRVDGSGLRSVKEFRQDNGLVHLQFGVQLSTVEIVSESIVFRARWRPVTDKRFGCTDCYSKIGAACGDDAHTPLHALLRHYIKRAVVRKEQVMDCSRRHTHCSLHTPTVQKVPVSSVGDADNRLLITVGVHLHSREHEIEQGGSQYASLLQSFGHRECFGYRPVVSDARRHLIMKMTHHVTFQRIEKDTGEDLTGDVEQRDASVIITELLLPLPFVEMDDGRVFEILRNFIVVDAAADGVGHAQPACLGKKGADFYVTGINRAIMLLKCVTKGFHCRDLVDFE
ncbi:unnamed protein product [Schistocephalus solidus]|uniref:VASt domain-containing protein n=1 Tax=Schistocephalus solidus TaxID=70667 RepID=A0A183T6E2_SCHSO|nr:unnamed protein product [Schistocephalus solidus]